MHVDNERYEFSRLYERLRAILGSFLAEKNPRHVDEKARESTDLSSRACCLARDCRTGRWTNAFRSFFAGAKLSRARKFHVPPRR